MRTCVRLAAYVLAALSLGVASSSAQAPASRGTLGWGDSAAVLATVLDSLRATRRPGPLVVGLLSCARVRTPCAAYGGWAEDSVRALALLAAHHVVAPRAGMEDTLRVSTLGAPLFLGADTASVMLYTVEGPPPRPGRGVAADFRLLLVRRAGRWHLVRWSGTRIT